MAVEQGTVVTLGLACVGAIIWFVRLEGRVNTGERLHEELTDHVKYIRERIDDALSK